MQRTCGRKNPAQGLRGERRVIMKMIRKMNKSELIEFMRGLHTAWYQNDHTGIGIDNTGKKYARVIWNKKTQQYHKKSDIEWNEVEKYATKKQAIDAGHQAAFIIKAGTFLEDSYVISYSCHGRLNDIHFILCKSE